MRCKFLFGSREDQYKQKQDGVSFDQDIEVAPVIHSNGNGHLSVKDNNEPSNNKFDTPNASKQKVSESDYGIEMAVSPDPIMRPQLMMSDRTGSIRKVKVWV